MKWVAWAFSSAFLFASFASAADAISPQMVVGDDFVCMLSPDVMGSAESKVRCWGTDGRTLSTPRVAGVTKLVGTEHLACMQSSTQTYCWSVVLGNGDHDHRDDAARINAFFGEKPMTSVFAIGSWRTAAVWSDADKLRAQATNGTHDAAEAWFTAAPENHPVALSIDEGVLCAISTKGETKCFSGKQSWRDGKPLSGFPMPQFSRAYEVGATFSHACVIEDGRVHCWGDWNEQKTPPLVAPHSLAVTKIAALAVDEGKLWRVNEKGAAADSGYPSKIDHIGLVAGYGENYCTANDTELACHFRNGCDCGGEDHKPDPPFEFRVEHRLKVEPSEIAAFDRLLTQLAGNVYAEKKVLLATATTLAKPLTPRGKLFIYQALAPLVENTDSEYVNKEILPAYLRLHDGFARFFNLTSLASFEVNAENTQSALRLVQATAVSLADTSAVWQEVTLRLGQAMASGDASSVQDLLKALQDAKPEIDGYLARARTKGQGQMLLDLIEYFRKVH